MQKSVMIGMSGGVDSSVAAYLLKEQGYRVVGAVMRMWKDCDMDADAPLENSEIQDARAVAEKLGIEFHVFDCRELFKKKVVDYFTEEYKKGRTPNPCVVCNKYLKFGAFLDKAYELGIDYVATGHYAKIDKDADGIYHLRTSESVSKDQSYMLYNFTQAQLARTLMPLGGYDKDEVRAIAAENGIITANKPDSQEICFIHDDDYTRFITEYDGYKPLPGKILDTEGNVLGEHRGLIYYTIGQRKGIGAYGRPMFVMKIEPESNTIILGEKGMEFSKSLTAEDVNFISGIFPNAPIRVEAKIRYKARPAGAVLEPMENGMVRLVFDESQRAVTPGQSVVFYDGDEVLGGGVVLEYE